MIVDFFGGLITRIFDLLLLPFRPLPPIWGLLFISVLAGLGMITLFRFTSNQEKIGRLRRRMAGEMLGILLHVGNPLVVMSFAVKLVWSNTIYLWLILKPLLVIALPFLLILGQLEARYSRRPIEPGEPITVTVNYEHGMPERQAIILRGDGIRIIPPSVLVDTLNEASFRIIASGEGAATLSIDGVTFPVGKINPWNGSVISIGFSSDYSLERLLSPWIAKPVALSNHGPVSARLYLPPASYRILRRQWSSRAVFLVVSSLAALGGALFLKVKI